MTLHRASIVAALLALLPSVGCQVISASIKSPFDSITGTGRAIGGIFEGISVSSGSGGGKSEKSSYVRDLRQYAAVFMQTEGGTTQDFERGVSRIAESHGITHWEADPATPYSIGQGLRLANLSEPEMLEFCERFGSDPEAARLALEGWRDAGN